MRTTAISQVFSVVGVLAVAGCALYFCEPITQPQTDTTERRRHAATEITVAKEDRSPQTNEEPPEVTTVVVPSRVHLPRRPTEMLVASSPQLVRQLQQELKRLGCYHHEINGEWTAVTRQAMKDFLERANAVLPVGKPEAAHLALLKGQAEPLCGTACPSGHILAKGNQCLPTALIAHATKQASMAKTTMALETPAVEAIVPPAPAPQTSRVRRARLAQPGPSFFGLLGF